MINIELPAATANKASKHSCVNILLLNEFQRLCAFLQNLWCIYTKTNNRYLVQRVLFMTSITWKFQTKVKLRIHKSVDLLIWFLWI